MIFFTFICIFVKNFANAEKFNYQQTTHNELSAPYCISDFDCVYGGFCVRDRYASNRRCFCPSACQLISRQCIDDKSESCLSSNSENTEKYDFGAPICYHKRCICPPTFDKTFTNPSLPILPIKCDRRELRANIATDPSNTIALGTAANIYCCVNVDPLYFLSQDAVYFVQNTSNRILPNETPYKNSSTKTEQPYCWVLHIKLIKYQHAGLYACMVQPMSPQYSTINVTMNLSVYDPKLETEIDDEAPDIIQNLQIYPNVTSVNVTWTMEDKHHSFIDLVLLDRSEKAKQVTEQKNALSPVIIKDLKPNTPYTLFITMRGEHAHASDGIPFSRQFSTKPSIPNQPPLEAIRLVNDENGAGQLCEIEWRPAFREREYITRYYVNISGKLRYIAPELEEDENMSELFAEDYPPGASSCVNFLRDSTRYINASTFHQRFFACKYGPLKPNRNYSASVWVENETGRSRPSVFENQCVTDFAEPSHIEAPIPMGRTNMSSFQLQFTQRPDEINGPIVCYYLAILPLPTNVSLAILPSPELVIMDTFDKAVQNNLHPSTIQKKRFFGYIAESYLQYPKQTIIGDGNTSDGGKQCSVLYLARHKPMDPALMPNLKYTGYLIARVDRDRQLQAETSISYPSKAIISPPIRDATPHVQTLINSGTRRRQTREASFRPGLELDQWAMSPANTIVIPLSALTSTDFMDHSSIHRRQLANVDPAYGFSDFFEPVSLQEHFDSAALIFNILLVILICFIFLTIVGLFWLFKNRREKVIELRDNATQYCARYFALGSPRHDRLRPMPSKPIRVTNLADDFAMRHRDSSFLYQQEFDKLPTGRDFDHTISKKYVRKNRYNDVLANEATRVRLRKIPGDDSSEYINANFIKGYKSRRTFIAAQGPMDNTIIDFWRMIWEQGAGVIIMLSNLREISRDACALYWPEENSSPLIARHLRVDYIGTHFFAGFTLRTFELVNLEDNVENDSSDIYANSNHDREEQRCSDYRTPSSLSDVVEKKSNENFGWRYGSMRESSSGPSSLHNVNALTRSSPLKNESRKNLQTVQEKRRVYQFHFISWNDHEAADCMQILHLMHRLRKLNDYNSAPVVVHCSAGIGRTGTLIALDYLLDQCQEEGIADVYKCVLEMRKQRNLMVQTYKQYVFIHKTLAEHYLYDNTDFNEEEFRAHYKRLYKPLGVGQRANSNSKHNNLSNDSAYLLNKIGTSTNSLSKGIRVRLQMIRKPNGSAIHKDIHEINSSNMSNNQNSNIIRQKNNCIIGETEVLANQKQKITTIQAEFKNLSISLERPYSTEFSLKPENIAKNHDPLSVPYDKNRVVLMHLSGYDSTYINASHLYCYFQNYIAAQTPNNAENAFDFWRMIYDNKVNTLVQLEPEIGVDFSGTSGARAGQWILGRNNELTVTLKSVEATNSAYMIRRLHCRFKYEKDLPGLEVTQFVFNNWKSSSSSESNVISPGSITSNSANTTSKLNASLSSNVPIPRNTNAFLDLVCAVLERADALAPTFMTELALSKVERSDSRPIIVQCKNGSTRNGLFCVVAALVERIRSDRRIDVFRTVKTFKNQRANLFNTIEEYAFCYECAIEFIGRTPLAAHHNYPFN